MPAGIWEDLAEGILKPAELSRSMIVSNEIEAEESGKEVKKIKFDLRVSSLPRYSRGANNEMMMSDIDPTTTNPALAYKINMILGDALLDDDNEIDFEQPPTSGKELKTDSSGKLKTTEQILQEKYLKNSVNVFEPLLGNEDCSEDPQDVVRMIESRVRSAILVVPARESKHHAPSEDDLDKLEMHTVKEDIEVLEMMTVKPPPEDNSDFKSVKQETVKDTQPNPPVLLANASTTIQDTLAVEQLMEEKAESCLDDFEFKSAVDFMSVMDSRSRMESTKNDQQP